MLEAITEKATEEILDHREIGGTEYTLKRIMDDFVVVETILIDTYETPYSTLAEAQFAYEVATGQKVAESQDYGIEYDAEPIGYYESTQPYLY